MGKTVKLVCDFSQGSACEKVILLAVEVDAHEVHLHHIANVFLCSFIAVEEARLVISPNCTSRYFIDLHSERITAVFVLTA
jgi:hypothetical protein